MKFIDGLCPPAYLYLIYIAVHVALCLTMGLVPSALFHVATGLVGVWLLDSFCRVDLGVVSWSIIAVPFLMTTLAMTIALGLQLDHAITKYSVEAFSPLTADNKKNRDLYVTQLKGGEAPIPSTGVV